MNQKKPIKRAVELVQYSKDHHHALLLGWKIRAGLKKGIAAQRICTYASWFYQNYLSLHFELEEKYIFPVLDGHELIKKACDDHRKLRALMDADCTEAVLSELADTLEAHIRFEEREVFKEIQLVATAAQLSVIDRVHNDEKFVEYGDEFWK